MSKCEIGTTCYIEENGIDVENYSIPVILSDETQVKRFSFEDGEYSLILSHSEDAVDLHRADILSIFVNHETFELPIGRFANLRLEDKKLKADALFDSEDEKSMMIFNKLSRGFLQSFSIGIEVTEKELVSEKDGHKTYKATKWTIFECSVVGVPAIANAKVGLNLRVANPSHDGETGKIQGTDMELDFTQDNFNILLANKETLDNRMSEVELKLETAETALVSKTEEMATLSDAHKTELQSTVGKQEKFVTQTNTRIKEAFAQNVANADTVVEMINAESDEKSSEILLNSEKTEALNQGEGDADVSAWANIVKTKG